MIVQCCLGSLFVFEGSTRGPIVSSPLIGVPNNVRVHLSTHFGHKPLESKKRRLDRHCKRRGGEVSYQSPNKIPRNKYPVVAQIWVVPLSSSSVFHFCFYLPSPFDRDLCYISFLLLSNFVTSLLLVSFFKSFVPHHDHPQVGRRRLQALPAAGHQQWQNQA